MATERYQKGLDKLQELILKEGDRPNGHMDIGEGFKDIAPDLEDYVVEFAFGSVYARPGTDNKQKVIATISALVAQGLPQIGMHVKTGLAVGLKPEEIVGTIMHLIPYCGFPKALNALRAVQEVFDEKGIKVDTSAVK